LHGSDAADATSPSGAEIIERLWSEREQPPPPSFSMQESIADAETAEPRERQLDSIERGDAESDDFAADFASTEFSSSEYDESGTEFAYDDGNNWSRTPLYILITVLVLVGGFFGWVLWTKRGITQQVGQQLADTDWIDTPQAPGGSDVPDDAAAMVQEDVELPAVGLQGGADPADQAKPVPLLPRPPSAPSASVPATVDATEEMRPIQVADPADEAPEATPQSVQRPGLDGSPAVDQKPVTTQPGNKLPETGSTGSKSPAAETEPFYTVHVGSFRHLDQAHQDIATLQKHGFAGRAVKTDLGGKGIWYRVYVGGFSTRSEAEKARDAILALPEYRYAQVKRLP
jgi:cell division septation protein DedD